MPATDRQRTIAIGVVIVLIVAAAVAPFASIQVGRVDAFIPVLQTVVSVVDLVTAILLFAQFSIQPQRALLALASGYIFSGSFAFLQTLAFPGGYAPAGLIGDGPNTPAWIYVLWHTMFPAAILAYALSKDTTGATRLPGRSAKTAIAITVACVLAVIAGLTWIVTTKTEYLPVLYTTDVRFQTRLGNQINIALLAMGCYRANRAAISQTHNPRSMVDGDFARLHAKLPGGDHRQLGTIYRRLVRGSLFHSGRKLHVADRVARRNDVSLFTSCQRYHFTAPRTHQPALERGSCHGRHRP